MQTTGKPFRKKVMPDTPSTVGAVAVLEAAFDLVEQNLEYSTAAERDFELIFDHLFETYSDLGEDRITALERTAERVKSIRSTIDRLAETPFLGTLRPDFLPGLRFVRREQAAVWSLANSSDNKTFVAAIFFGAQDHIRKMLTRLLSD
ncbi:hypothetical protein SIAM614_00035 [Stappia aggregata IAM 12614]|uniref:Uncharacterized protein n=1 Tax=Roseibium aggregatum (strain ATCC 25650 / DSM 13394 / JCM 20685 / NBRC 16684 / NCIMB 2208 / IAM 12614 / B1) TaxID=384765 RepID=A0P489_ROSAI|nr:type II toxin-antitoxin system RelE/ParE family toxin [Roseibium aggregatum]EAV40146.1 hypothetical protein SIAM614_00035 [Stappia aggregata IAM 12614] [Roseibium aggregatum IAM 12614]